MIVCPSQIRGQINQPNKKHYGLYITQRFPKEVDYWRGFLTISCCSRTLGYCFLEIFVGEGGNNGLKEGDKVVIGGIPTRENPVTLLLDDN